MTPTPRQSNALVAAALLAAGALGAWQASRVASQIWPSQEVRGRGGQASLRRGPAASSGEEMAAGGSHPQAAPRDGSRAEPRTEQERAAAAELADGMKRLVRDLEFNAGLPEPPQQVVVRPPAPWRPAGGEEVLAAPVIDAVEPRAGPAAGGTRVTLRGRYLRAAQVMFGTSPADIASAGPEAVTVVAPPAVTGPVVIALTNDDGSYAVASSPFTYGD